MIYGVKMSKEEMKERITHHIENIRIKYLNMLMGKTPLDCEELLFQLEEGINQILKEDCENNDENNQNKE